MTPRPDMTDAERVKGENNHAESYLVDIRMELDKLARGEQSAREALKNIKELADEGERHCEQFYFRAGGS